MELCDGEQLFSLLCFGADMEVAQLPSPNAQPQAAEAEAVSPPPPPWTPLPPPLPPLLPPLPPPPLPAVPRAAAPLSTTDHRPGSRRCLRSTGALDGGSVRLWLYSVDTAARSIPSIQPARQPEKAGLETPRQPESPPRIAYASGTCCLAIGQPRPTPPANHSRPRTRPWCTCSHRRPSGARQPGWASRTA